MGLVYYRVWFFLWTTNIRSKFNEIQQAPPTPLIHVGGPVANVINHCLSIYKKFYGANDALITSVALY